MKLLKRLAFLTLLFIGGQQVNADTLLDAYGVKNAVAVEEASDGNVDWIELQSQNNVALNKAWKVNFSQAVSFDKLDGAVIEKDEQYIPVEIKFTDRKQMTITPVEQYEAGKTYTLKVFLNNGKRYKLSFTTTRDLNSLIDAVDVTSHNRQYLPQLIYVPPMPKEGFHFGYYLRLPSEQMKNRNGNDKATRYIMIDTPNVMIQNLEGTKFLTARALENQEYYSIQLAEETYSIMLMPVTPRTNTYYDSPIHGSNAIDAHSFDRDAAIMDQLVNDPDMYNEFLKPDYAKFGLTPEMYVDYDEQIVRMFEHAVKYLATQNIKVAEKFIIAGYSSGGTFSDRISMLQPQKVKMVISGGTLDDMVTPVAEHNGETLVFPTGIADYKEITGRDFDINEVNKIAKLVFMGEDDEQTPLMYFDAYSDKERKAIISAFGQNTLQRAKEMMKVYHDNGGKGMFILDAGVQHWQSEAMTKYTLQFVLANRDAKTPVYPIPQNPKQLKYDLKQ